MRMRGNAVHADERMIGTAKLTFWIPRPAACRIATPGTDQGQCCATSEIHTNSKPEPTESPPAFKARSQTAERLQTKNTTPASHQTSEVYGYARLSKNHRMTAKQDPGPELLAIPIVCPQPTRRSHRCPQFSLHRSPQVIHYHPPSATAATKSSWTGETHFVERSHGLVCTPNLHLEESRLVPVAVGPGALHAALLRIIPGAGTAKDILLLLAREVLARV